MKLDSKFKIISKGNLSKITEIMGSIFEELMQIWAANGDKYNASIDQFENIFKAMINEIVQEVSDKIVMRDILTLEKPATAIPDIEDSIKVLESFVTEFNATR